MLKYYQDLIFNFFRLKHMPELPEVQTIVSDLQKILPGLKIGDVWTDWKKMFKNISLKNSKKKLREKNFKCPKGR